MPNKTMRQFLYAFLVRRDVVIAAVVDGKDASQVTPLLTIVEMTSVKPSTVFILLKLPLFCGHIPFMRLSTTTGYAWRCIWND